MNEVEPTHVDPALFVTSTCWLEQTEPAASASPELRAIVEQAVRENQLRTFLHHEAGSDKVLVLTTQLEMRSLDDAFRYWMNVRRWRAMSVGIRGSLQKRLADQKAIGRRRAAGERSPVPLPDWYDMTHAAYGHAAELGFDPSQPLWIVLPPPSWEYVNYAEALHVQQPAG